MDVQKCVLKFYFKLCIHFNNDDCCIKEDMICSDRKNKCMLYIILI